MKEKQKMVEKGLATVL